MNGIVIQLNTVSSIRVTEKALGMGAIVIAAVSISMIPNMFINDFLCLYTT